MRLAIIGTRGIPANYGGFETFAEELAPRLVEKGHDVTVYGRSNAIDWPDDTYKGVRLVILPTIPTKYTDTPIHTVLSCFHALFQGFDVVLACNAANAPLLLPLRLAGVPVALNVDGIERMRRKWGMVGRAWYRMGEYFATVIPSAIVADARVIQEYYETEWNATSIMIPYGADARAPVSQDELSRWGLQARRYVLVVTRLEPENNADLVIEAFRAVRTDMNLVIVGDAPYANQYRQRVVALAAADERVVMTGYVYGEGYRQLQSNAYCFVQATEVGGTHPALIEGMALCGCVLANGTPENREVVGDAGMAYSQGDRKALATAVQTLIDHPDIAEDMRLRAKARVETHYSWSAVVDEYERLLEGLVQRT